MRTLKETTRPFLVILQSYMFILIKMSHRTDLGGDIIVDEQIIRTLQEQAIEERQYIQEKYGQDEDVVQVVNRRDYLTGRQSAAVRLYDNERNVPLHRHGYIELMYAYKGTFTHRFGEEKCAPGRG